MRLLYTLTLAAGLFLSACSGNDARLPIYGDREAVEKNIDGKVIIDTAYHTIPAFSFLNQDSVLITDKNFDNKIYIANYIFTH